MRKVVNKLKWIGLIVLIVAFIGAVYPLYVHWVAGNYTKKFAIILNSHDMKQYDKFFSKDTVFELNGEEIEYSKARENMEKVQKFSCGSSYGNESLVTNVYFEKEFDVGLMLPIAEYDNGEDIVKVGMLEADIILERKWIFFFSIKNVIFDYDNEGFLENFLGIGKDENASEEAADPIIMRVAGWNMEYTPIDRKLTVEDFEAVELGISEQDVKDKIGEPNGYIAKELGIGHWAYVLEDGRVVGLAFHETKLDSIMLYEGDIIVDVVKIELEPNQVRVDGMILDCPPEERFTIVDFDDVELGDTYSDMVEKVGKGNYDVGYSNSGNWIDPIYILEDGKAVIAYFMDGYDLYKLVVFDGDNQDYVLKSVDENDIK